MSLKLEQRKVFGIDWENYRIDRRIERSLFESEEEILVFGSKDGIYCFDGNNVKKIVERDNMVWDLVVWNGELYDAAGKKIYRTRDNRVVAERDASIYALAVWNGELYDAGNYRKIYRTRGNRVVAERDASVVALVVWNGELYDATWTTIYRTRDNKVILDSGEILRMCTVPRSVLRGLI
jgi:hypothetical protein